MQPTTRRWFANGLLYAIALLFVVAGVSKLLDIEDFASSISEFGIVADAALGTAAWSLALSELVLGILLVVGPATGVRLAIALLLVFSAVLGFGIAKGLDVDCGCLPFGIAESLHLALLRNIVLLLSLAFVTWARPRQHERVDLSQPKLDRS